MGRTNGLGVQKTLEAARRKEIIREWMPKAVMGKAIWGIPDDGVPEWCQNVYGLPG